MVQVQNVIVHFHSWPLVERVTREIVVQMPGRFGRVVVHVLLRRR